MSETVIPLSRQLNAVADAVAAVRAGRSLTEALAQCPAELRPAAQALSFAVLRQLGAALVLRPMLAPRPPPPAVEALLLSALALLWPTASPAAYPDHTLVDQAVAAARRRAPAAAGFVNAVLRRFVREREALVAAALREPQARHQHPAWWIERVRADWPDQWAGLLATANAHPPMVLRVNTRRISVADYRQQLQAAGLSALEGVHPDAPQALVLARPCPVPLLPGFEQGWVSVQDLSAQRAALLLLAAEDAARPAADAGTSAAAAGRPPLPALPPRARVLDACAAPGGKTAHLLELADLDLLALDSDAQRLARVGQTLQRLGLQAELRCADARDVATWWDGRPFDAILLDAPCTGSGIVRRHPDVRWLRRPADVATLARTQATLLDALWPLLAPGGRLLYATCSIFRAEGQDQIDAFLQRTGPAAARWVPASPGHLLPLPDNDASAAVAPQGDGFFYALITPS